MEGCSSSTSKPSRLQQGAKLVEQRSTEHWLYLHVCGTCTSRCLQSWCVLFILNALQIITVFAPSFTETSKNQFAVSYLSTLIQRSRSLMSECVCASKHWCPAKDHKSSSAKMCSTYTDGACVCVCARASACARTPNSKAGSAAWAWSHGKYAASLHCFSKQWETQKASEA